MVLPAQHTSRQRGPSQYADVHSLGQGDQFALHRSLHQAIFDLQADKVRPASKLRERVRLGDLPGRSVRDADVKHLAMANQIVKASHDFLYGCYLVPDMHPVEVNVVGPQSLQAGLDGLYHVLAVVARCVWIVAGTGVAILGGNDHALAVAAGERQRMPVDNESIGGPATSDREGSMACDLTPASRAAIIEPLIWLETYITMWGE